MKAADRDALLAVFGRFRRASIPAAGVRVVWRQEGGQFLYAVKDAKEAQMLTAAELRVGEPLMAAILDARPEANVLIRSLPDYAGGITQIRNCPSFRPALDDALKMIGNRVMLAGSDQPGRIQGILQNKDACIVRPSKKYGEPAPYVLVLGKTPAQATVTTLVLEKACRALLEGTLLGGMKRISFWLLLQKGLTFEGSWETDGLSGALQINEIEGREKVVHCVNWLLEENLIQTAPGAVSVRLDGAHMLLAARGCGDRPLSPEDVVRVRIQTLENDGGIAPSFDLKLQAAIMDRYEDVGCCVLTRAGASSVFAACRQPVPITGREDGDLPGDRTGYASARLRPIIKALGRTVSGACILGNRGAVITGKSVEDVIDRCGTMEDAARRYLGSKVRELRG
ncbi:MAG: class II aldolase/adducin family protein [Clostridiaceae bacterium]|nr:class II aldolase/adducin family protein [Clostridiaceae bacterium]